MSIGVHGGLGSRIGGKPPSILIKDVSLELAAKAVQGWSKSAPSFSN